MKQRHLYSLKENENKLKDVQTKAKSISSMISYNIIIKTHQELIQQDHITTFVTA